MRSRLLQLTVKATLIGGLTFTALPAFSQESGGFEAGVTAYENGRYPDAIAVWEPLADKGDINSLNMLAQLHRLGLGVQQDDEKAFELYEMAAERGSDEAQVNVAFQLLTGKGVEQDREKAASWFAKAADSGNALAQYNLGLMYEKGIGVEQDREFATELYQVSADQGQKRAIARLEALEESNDGQAEAAAKAAEEEAKMAAAKAKARAEEKAAKIAEAKAKAKEELEKKRPVLSIKKVDPASPLEFEKLDGDDGKMPSYKSAAEENGVADDRPVINVVRTPMRKPGEKVADAPKGNEPTPIYIKRMDANGDEEEGASGAASKSAEAPEATQMRAPSDPAARVMAAERAYRSGDFTSAASMIEPLSNAGMPVAQFWMGRLYNRGEGVDLNRAEAYSLWRSAAAGGSERAATALANLAARLSPEEISVAEQRHAASGRAR